MVQHMPTNAELLHLIKLRMMSYNDVVLHVQGLQSQSNYTDCHQVSITPHHAYNGERIVRSLRVVVDSDRGDIGTERNAVMSSGTTCTDDLPALEHCCGD